MMMRLPPRSEQRSEFDDIREVDDIWINLGLADGRAVQRGISVDVDPPHVGPQGRTVFQLIVQADLHREAEAVVKLKRTQRRFFLEERGVVNTGTDIGLEGPVGRKVVVQRQGRWQVLGCARTANSINVDGMLKRCRNEQFDAQIVTDKVFCRESRAHVIANVSGVPCQCAVTRLRHNRSDTKTKGNITLRLRSSGGRSDSGKKEGGKCDFHNSAPVHIHGPNLRCTAAERYDLNQNEWRFPKNILMFDALKVLGRDNLMGIFPQETSRVARVPFRDRISKVFEKPGQVAPPGNEHAGSCAKPADTIDLSLLARTVRHAHRCVKMIVEPIQHAAHLLDLPKVLQVITVIPNVKGRTKDAVVATGFMVPNAGLKSDIHVDFLRVTQTFLRKRKMEFNSAERADVFSSEFNQLLLQRKTYQSHGGCSALPANTAKYLPGKPGQSKHHVQRMETVA